MGDFITNLFCSQLKLLFLFQHPRQASVSFQSAYRFQSPTLVELSRGNVLKEEVVYEAHVLTDLRSADFSFDTGCCPAAALSVWFNAVTS